MLPFGPGLLNAVKGRLLLPISSIANPRQGDSGRYKSGYFAPSTLPK